MPVAGAFETLETDDLQLGPFGRSLSWYRRSRPKAKAKQNCLADAARGRHPPLGRQSHQYDVRLAIGNAGYHIITFDDITLTIRLSKPTSRASNCTSI